MLVECSHCGAPLDVVADAKTITCAYCSRRQLVPRLHTISPQTPAEWQPPAVWTPPTGKAESGEALRFNNAKSAARTTVRVVTVLAAVALLGSAGLAYVLAQRVGEQEMRAEQQLAALQAAQAHKEEAREAHDAAQSSHDLAHRLGGAANHLGGDSAADWDGTQPYECSGNSRVTLQGVTTKLTDRTAIVASANCRLHVVDCEIDAWQAIEIGGNARVIVEGSTLTAKGDGVELQSNGRLELHRTTLTAGGIAITAGGNSRVLLGSGQITGEAGALTLRANARAERRSSDVTGEVRGRRSRLKGWPR